MPTFVRQALADARVTSAYRARPAYQRNDYIGWITSPAREETKRKRLTQMITELEKGGVYMKMKWKPRSGR